MKFSKHIEKHLVVEWKSQYFDYKKAKKLIHKVEASTANKDSKCPLKQVKVIDRTSQEETSSALPPLCVNIYDSQIAVLLETPDQVEFLTFLNSELEKIETFLKGKKEDLFSHLNEIELQIEKYSQLVRLQNADTRRSHPSTSSFERVKGEVKKIVRPILLVKPLSSKITEKSSLPRTSVARRKLKHALALTYKELELLRDFRWLNHEAFRKILKKYNKTARHDLSSIYFMHAIDKGQLEDATDINNHLSLIEDLFSSVFTHHSKKQAVLYLRTFTQTKNFTSNSIFVGFMIGAGIPLSIQGISYATNEKLVTTNYYLLQVWAAFFLVVLFLLLFGLNCIIWSINRINYKFIFGFSSRRNLSWQQYLEIPSIFFFLFSLFFYLNFAFDFGKAHTYFPLIFLGSAILVGCQPFYYQRNARKRFLIANLRIFFSGLFAVKFQDFFLGDQYNSLTYSFGNIELFFCLYAHQFTNPIQCNSTRSPLLGFFTTLPAIWRFLQCIRRFSDTRCIFPHLANAGKYTASILYYMSLSLWRRNQTKKFEIIFIVFAIINSTYTSYWDVKMDWNLMSLRGPRPLLRKRLIYQYVWIYYVAIIIDVCLRFSWIFYVIYPKEIQHSASVSFFIAFVEVLRRFQWNFFRVEQEEVFNREHLRAIREITLPFLHDQLLESSKHLKTTGRSIDGLAKRDFAASQDLEGGGDDDDGDDDDDDEEYYHDEHPNINTEV